MNIKITYNWLLDFLDTDADPYELQKYLSLSGPAIERIEKVGDDYVLDFEVTSNRVDTASVLGFAQEACVILPQYGKRAKLRNNPLATTLEVLSSSLKKVNNLPISIEIKGKDLASRITAIVLSDVQIKESNKVIKERLELCGHHTINNVVDASNYLRISLGIPCHIFDYDQIGKAQMTVRLSKKGEKITTLDKDTLTLPGDDIVIEDGDGKLVDQPGIMGAYNSSVQPGTKNILLFVPIFNGTKVRRTSMITGKRSDSATYFEKGLDEERTVASLQFALHILQKDASAHIASEILDLYPNPEKAKEIVVSHEFIMKRIGVEIESKRCVEILEALGCIVVFDDAKKSYTVTAPSWRAKDMTIPEDVVEEIARIYGYHNLPNVLPPLVYVQQPKEIEDLFAFQIKVKMFLKHLGLHESMNYSFISEELIKQTHLELKNHMKVANPISHELVYMRTSLIPSLIKNLKDNEGKRDVLKLFELSKVYYPNQEKRDELPKEIYKLAIATNTSFLDLKGIVESLLHELVITNYALSQSKIHIFSKKEVIDFVADDGCILGSIGKLSAEISDEIGLKKSVYLASFDVLALIERMKPVARYVPTNPYATVKLDLTVSLKNNSFSQIQERAFKNSEHLEKLEVVDSYKDTITLRLYFASKMQNLTEVEAQKELESIKKALA